jgi:hypothetical protein
VTIAEGMDVLHGYMEAGFGGFTIRNVAIRTPDAVARVGELIKAMRSGGSDA